MTTTTNPDRTPDLEAISQRLLQSAWFVQQSSAYVLDDSSRAAAMETLEIAMDQLRQVHEVLTTATPATHRKDPQQ